MTPHRRFSKETHDETAKQIRARMRHLCAHMSETDFDAMVEEMARVQLKYEAITTDHVLRIAAMKEPNT